MKFHKGLAYFFFLLSIEALGCAVFLLSIPADPKNSILWGFSLPRLTSFFLFLLLIATGAILGYRSLTSDRFANFLKSKILDNDIFLQLSFLLTITVFSAALYTSFLPSYRLGGYLALYHRTRPLLIFLLLFSAQSNLMLIFFGLGIYLNRFREYLIKERLYIFKVLLIFLLFVVILGIVAFTKLGITPGQIWEKNGIPLLFSQVIFLGVTGLWLILSEKIIKKIKPKWTLRINAPRFELVIFLALWLICGLMWLREPLPYNAVNPGPFPPNDQYYPYADGAYYYSYTQWAMIGQPIPYVDKPLYAAFLFGLRLFSGSEFNTLILWQALLFGVLPAIIYLIARQITSRNVSILVALGVGMQINNSIASSLYAWKVSQPKMTMSEIPTGILLALLTYWLMRWVRTHKTRHLLLAGGTFGLSTLVRHNVWLILPFIFMYLLVASYSKWKEGISASIAFSCLLLVAIAPWMIRTEQMQGTPFYFLIPFKGVILGERYTSQTAISQNMQSGAFGVPIPDGTTTADVGTTLLSANASGESLFVKIGAVGVTAGNQFAHNLITNVFILPTQLSFDNLENTIINNHSPSLFDYIWDGKLNPNSLVILIIGLAILAFGVGFSLQTSWLFGLNPLILFLIYNAATAVGNTSGGRYIVPTDWVVVFYFVIGLSALAGFVKPLLGLSPGISAAIDRQVSLTPLRGSKGFRAYFGIALIFALLGSTPVIFERIFPAEYTNQDEQQVLRSLVDAGVLNEANLTVSLLNDFLQQPGAVLFEGRSVSPRYLDYQDDRSEELFSHINKDLPQLTFQFIGPTNALVTMPMQQPPQYLPNESDVIVLGCQFNNPGINVYLDSQLEAFFVIVKQQAGYALYTRQPALIWNCSPQD
jgi:hypothetical protein